MTQMEVIEGTVEAVNERGVRLAGNWYNVSKYRAVELPQTGAWVQLGVDPKGFILEVTTLDATDKTPAVSRDERENTRLAVLAVAAQFLGQLAHTRDDVRSDHVLMLADKWLEWVER